MNSEANKNGQYENLVKFSTTPAMKNNKASMISFLTNILSGLCRSIYGPITNGKTKLGRKEAAK